MWITGADSAHFWGRFNVGKAALKEKKGRKREKKGGKYEALNSWVSAYMHTARSCASIVL
jgi:hypothetical protein